MFFVNIYITCFNFIPDMVKSPGQGIFCQLYLNINKLIILKITFGNHFKFKKKFNRKSNKTQFYFNYYYLHYVPDAYSNIERHI